MATPTMPVPTMGHTTPTMVIPTLAILLMLCYIYSCYTTMLYLGRHDAAERAEGRGVGEGLRESEQY